MAIKYTSEGDLVADLIYGRGEKPRDTAPEPSLLPQLGARLCHDFSINEVLDVARDLARHSGNAPPFTPLWEATVWGIAERKDLVDHLDDFGVVSDNHWRVIRTLQTRNKTQARQLADAGVLIGGDYPDFAGVARLSPLLPPTEAAQLLDPSSIDPADFDSESLRSLLTAASLHDLEVPDVWLDEALSNNWFGLDEASHLAHVLPSLPAARRAAVADRLAGSVLDWRLPPDQRALWVSRIAPFVSSPKVWNTDALLRDLSPVWRTHVNELQSAAWPGAPWDDVFRAHPADSQFASVERPHEVTVSAPSEILARWSPPETATLGPERGIADSTLLSGDTGSEEEAPHSDAPRRLQANVHHGSSGKQVAAFVANEEHNVKVSIGRDGQVQANVDMESRLKELFEKTDTERLELPIWFHYGQERQEGSVTVPRKLSEDSTTCDFTLTAPSNGRVVARIHVMRPGGRLLLQSAALIGDVVDNVEAAEDHDEEMQLNVDVLAGNLGDPVEDSSGRTLVADREAAITRSEGKLIELQLTEMQNRLRSLVSEIEFSADAQDFDDSAMEETLLRLALAGRQLWVTFKRQLQELASSDYLQIVSLIDDYMLPLELVYDGPALSPSSKLCPTWRDALKAGDCSGCENSDGTGDGAAPVCPLKFWSMSKIIERRLADARGGAFRVRAERSRDNPTLRTVSGMVVAASSRVETRQVDDLADFARTTLQIATETAKDWSKWIDKVKAETPELLVAMPHNESIADGFISALLVGEPASGDDPPPDESTLMAGHVTDAHVQTSEARPGPIVLLLGCDTLYQEGKLAGFAGEFRDNGAAITVSTIGKLRADQATLAAETLVAKLVSDAHKGSGIGEAVREARRELLSKNLIMALLLVANGDAEWTLPS